MVAKYTINLRNKSSDVQTFWCFLEIPEELAADKNVYANSSASLTVVPHDSGVNKFVVPAQYFVGAGASNKAVELGVEVMSAKFQKAEEGQGFLATYNPPNQGPALTSPGKSKAPNMVSIETSPFDKKAFEGEKWFGNQSFGVQTEKGFMGMSWSPRPAQVRTLKPKLTFYVTAGTFGSNMLADWTEVSTTSKSVSTEGDFKANEVTIVYNPDGSWSLTY